MLLGTSLLSTIAIAEDGSSSNWYIKSEAGAAFSNDAGTTDMSFTHGPQVTVNDSDLGVSPVFGIGIGRQIYKNFRGDVTFNYRGGFELDTESTDSLPASPLDADIKSYSLMANLYWDIYRFDAGQLAITPYLSGGAGVAINQTDDMLLIAGGTNAAEISGGTKTNFAFQVGAGAGIEMSEHLTLDLGYRYVDLGEFQSGKNLPSVPSVKLNDPIKGDLTSHEIMIGLRYNF
ncbi:outer membrane protein [Roseibium sp. SCP14]|uniref:outer membrane protein n=1 Tax=Roseibium sp. SCP14 TaxID=3141375 RepID=UPI003339CB3C